MARRNKEVITGIRAIKISVTVEGYDGGPYGGGYISSKEIEVSPEEFVKYLLPYLTPILSTGGVK